MKELNTKNKIIAIILAIIIIIGMAITFTTGLSFELKYQETQKLQLFIGKDFEISDIKQMTDEIFPNQKVIIQKAREFEDVAHITTKTITDEQKNNLITKINEKYSSDLKTENIETITVPHTRARDIVKPYILPLCIVTLIILVAMLIKYRKLNMKKILFISILWIILAQIILLSIIAITRIPVGRLTNSMILTIYILTLMGLTKYFDKQKAEANQKDVEV